MEINFTKIGNNYVSEFQAAGAFNLHIEGVAEGDIKVYQRTTDNGEFARVKESGPVALFNKVYDCDFSAAVYPKYIKVVCPERPAKAVVTTNA